MPYVVKCPNYSSRHKTLGAAERRKAYVENLGACQHDHEIVEVPVKRRVVRTSQRKLGYSR